MKDDYLWDGTGEPDPEVQKLETVLGRYRHNQPAPDFDQIAQTHTVKRPGNSFNWRWKYQLSAVAASLLLAATAFLFMRQRSSRNLGPSWDVARLEGAPRVGWHFLGEKSGPGKLGIGQTLVTDSSSRASITLDETGRVEVDPGSRLRLLTNGPGRKRLSLERGTIHAVIWAPPGQFVVDTPSAVAVDLGCVYTLHVEDSGAGLLRTTMGWVGFKLNGHESFIPAGAICQTRPKIGPGTPYREDASASFRDALSRFDFESHIPAERNALLGVLLVDARKDDALTLWHLLSRVNDAERPGVYDRLASLASPPAGVTREGILRLDRAMLDAWWNSLGFGDVYLWRTYERDWSKTSQNTK
ncbi:MAG TPA: FecR family protein [Candidatus Polarisedimenticolia bacterium]|nr:FecR family protein [Candidatus Polarisedimenticolia bacterium]